MPIDDARQAKLYLQRAARGDEHPEAAVRPAARQREPVHGAFPTSRALSDRSRRAADNNAHLSSLLAASVRRADAIATSRLIGDQHLGGQRKDPS
jgi:hypothetical protein